MQRLIVCALVAVLAAVLGPRLVGPQSHAAGAPFAYEPPEGFVRAKGEKQAEPEGTQVWVYEGVENPSVDGSRSDRSSLTRIVVSHSNKEMSVEETELAKLVAEMPKAFEGSCSWVHRRHEMRARADGARVGLIEGDCDKEIDLGALGLPAQTVKTRKLQLMFPDDAGTSIVTASYPTDQAARWEPLFEATIGKARGVATRAPAPAPWAYGAWAGAGAVLGWLATAIAFRTGSEPAKPAPEKNAKNAKDRARDEEEDDEDDDEEDDDDDSEGEEKGGK